MTQLSIPVDVSSREITREKTLGDAIALCIKVGGLEAKELSLPFKLDKAQLSRWQSDDEGIKWHKLRAVMDACGNDAPLLWMLHDRGYELSSVRKRETETEQRLRVANERIKQLEVERDVERRLFREMRAA